MVQKRPHHIPHFKISQYIVALIMGLTAAWLAPRNLSPEINHPSWRPFEEKVSSSLPWWTPPSISNPPSRSLYPWVQYWSRIDDPTIYWHTLTQDDFRCRGNGAHPPITLIEETGKSYLFDCWGYNHGLPWFSPNSNPSEGRERIPPVLIEMLNDLQTQLQSPVVILSGHRCLTHHRYITRAQGSSTDKHLIAAAVDFYVEGYQSRPRELFQAIDRIQRARKEKLGSKWSAFHEKQTGYWVSSEIDLKYHTAESPHTLDHLEAPFYCELIACYDYQLRQPIRYSYPQARALPLE